MLGAEDEDWLWAMGADKVGQAAKRSINRRGVLPDFVRVSDILCMSNLVHASKLKEHEDNDDYQ